MNCQKLTAKTSVANYALRKLVAPVLIASCTSAEAALAFEITTLCADFFLAPEQLEPARAQSPARKKVCTSEPVSRSVLLIPDVDHVGFTTYDAKDPETKFPPIRDLRPPSEAPNILLVPIDDAGFGETITETQ